MPDGSQISKKRRFQIEETILILLLMLSLGGIGINDFSRADGYGYWILMVFVFAICAIIIAWLQSKHDMDNFKSILREQSLHWLSSLLIVGGASLILRPDDRSSLVILLILSLATVLDGLRVGWRFSLVGIFLGISAIIPVYTVHFFWVELIIVVGIVVITILWDYIVEKMMQR